MNPLWTFDDEDDVEHGRVLEKAYKLNEDELGHKIPKIFRRSLLYLSKNADTKKSKKTTALNSSPQESIILNLHETYKNQQKILELEKRLGVTIVQRNGQRKLGGPPPGWTGPPPGAGCEVFVGRIPRTVYEDVLYPIFNQAGEIYEMRLMMNFSGTNRGFCFVMYTKPEYAQNAINKLNNYPINDGWCLGVVKSVNNCRLHITELSSSTNAKALIEKIWPMLDDIDEISVFTNLNNHQIKHALIAFKTHRGAAMARRSLLPERNSYFGKNDVRIEWAHPKISITNVIEETGKMNSDGKLIITSKIIPGDKKSHSNDRKNKAMNNSSKPQKVGILRHAKAPNNYNQKSLATQENFNGAVDYNFPYFYSPESCNNNSFDECQMSLKNSMSSDESLSDFSKSSECDECRYSSCSLNSNVPHYSNVPVFLDPRNCSVVRYPWGVNQNPDPNLNISQNPAFYHVPFPWRAMTNQNTMNNVPLPNAMINFDNNHVPKVMNNYNSNNVNARPILNRNL